MSRHNISKVRLVFLLIMIAFLLLGSAKAEKHLNDISNNLEISSQSATNGSCDFNNEQTENQTDITMETFIGYFGIFMIIFLLVELDMVMERKKKV
ncbi:MAG: hypothetical protein IJ220_07185 [Clostridia bacterium]|nr:hypothetical protein [Clostridia bacterium]